MPDQFDQQLLTYKSALIPLYKRKTKLVSERETLRFQYVTVMRSQFNSLAAAIYAQAFQDKNADGELLARILLSSFQANIPMSTLSGGAVEGWMRHFQLLGGDYGTHFLSPTEYFFKPYYASASPPVPLYKQMKLAENYGDRVDVFVDNNFLYNIKGNHKFEDVSNIWSNSPVTGMVYLSFPLQREWIYGFLKTRWGSDKYDLVNQSEYVSALFSKSYNGMTLTDLLDQMRAMLTRIFTLTIDIVKVQIAIDDAESELASFVNDYQAYTGQNLDFNSILASILSESEKADQPVIQEPPVGSTVVESGPAPVVQTMAPAPVPEKKSLLPWVAAAAGLFVLTRNSR